MKMSLWKWLESVDISRTSAYGYIKMYQDELVRMGCLEVKRTARKQRIFVIDGDCIVRFLSKHGIYVKDIDSVGV